MKHIKHLNFFSIFIIFFLLISSNTVFSQAIDIEMLGKEVAKKVGASGPAVDIDSADEYKSYIKNQYSNVINQSGYIDRKIEEDLFLTELQQERMELASKLCSKDPRSCFLIDEYKNYSQEIIPTSHEDLTIFGLDMFAGYPNMINSYEAIPISDDYILKPGDQIRINITGSINHNEEIKISPSGIISIDEIGDIFVAGMSLKDATVKFNEFVESRYLGTETFLDIGKLTLNQVFALGAVNFPGSYNISPLSSALNSLISSGGFKQNASLRSIQILRKGINIRTIDLYDFLIFGNSELSWNLQSGDTILVDGTSDHISIVGEINRPAIYEMKEGDTLARIIKFALGFTPYADLQRISVKRMNPTGDVEIFNVAYEDNFLLQPGDKLEVNSKLGSEIDLVKIHGEIKSNGDYKYKPNLSLGELIDLNTDLLDSTYTLFGVVKRFNFATRTYSISNFDLINQSRLNNFELLSKDEVFIFNKEDIQFINSKTLRDAFNSASLDKKEDIVEDISELPFSEMNGDINSQLINSPSNESKISSGLKCYEFMNNIRGDDLQRDLTTKLNFFNSLNNKQCSQLLDQYPDLLPILLANAIPVIGNVREPGLVPVSNLISFNQVFNYAGGLNNLKFPSYAEAASYGNKAVSFEINASPKIDNLAYVNVKTKENGFQTKFVTLTGEFISPGVYPINANTTLLDIYERAGGVTSHAYSYGAILTRERIKLNEEDALKRTKGELTELMTGALASGYLKQSSTDLIALLSIITSVENTKAQGRLIAELNPQKISRDPSLNIFLENNDVIYMPKLDSTITISGSVLNPVTVPYTPGRSFSEYIRLAGGYKSNADKSKVYAIKPNGEAISSRSSFLSFRNDPIVPGTTIIVPRRVRVFDGIALVETITPVLANLSVTAASIAAINNN